MTTLRILLKDQRTHVYRIYDKAGELVYIGLTNNLCQRIANHWGGAPFKAQMHAVEWETFDTKKKALAVERRLIEDLGPRWNVAHNESVRPKPEYEALELDDDGLLEAEYRQFGKIHARRIA